MECNICKENLAILERTHREFHQLVGHAEMECPTPKTMALPERESKLRKAQGLFQENLAASRVMEPNYIVFRSDYDAPRLTGGVRCGRCGRSAIVIVTHANQHGGSMLVQCINPLCEEWVVVPLKEAIRNLGMPELLRRYRIRIAQWFVVPREAVTFDPAGDPVDVGWNPHYWTPEEFQRVGLTL